MVALARTQRGVRRRDSEKSGVERDVGNFDGSLAEGNFDGSLAEANFPLSYISLNFIFLGRISSALSGTDERVSSVETTGCGKMALRVPPERI
jgi:hypothetical protein